MSPFDSIDIYCERLGPEFWAEPLNFLTNLAFLYAAWLLLRRDWPRPARPEVRRLALLIAVVGLCSALFHSLGQRWTGWADVASIAVLIMVFLQRWLRRIGGCSLPLSLLGLVLFIATDRALAAAVPALGVTVNGTEAYFTAWLALLLLARATARRCSEGAGWLSVAAALFPLSMLLRSLDLAWCETWPAGTHFAWHLLNAAVLYLAARGLAAAVASHRLR